MKKTRLFVSMVFLMVGTFWIFAVPLALRAQIVKSMARFEIGADFVNPSPFSRWAWTQLTPVYIDSFAVPTRPPFIPNLKSIGITLPHIHIHGTNGTWPRNLVHMMADSGLRTSLQDENLMAASRWERRYFQVEDTADFGRRTGGIQQTEASYHTDSLRFDLHPKNYLTSNPNYYNGIRFRDGVDQGAIISQFRHRNWLYVNGRYYVTIRMGIPRSGTPPNNDNVACLFLRMRTDSMMFEWRIPGSAFYLDNTPRTGGFEYLPVDAGDSIATILLRSFHRDSAHVTYRIEHECTLDWGAGHFDNGEDYAGYGGQFLPSPDSLAAQDFEIELEYQGPGDIFVDAICFSDPQGYGFFVGDDHALSNFQGGRLRDSVGTTLHNLGVGGDANNHPAYLELQEASPMMGCLTTMNMITRMIDDSTGTANTVHTFNYGHPSRDMDRLAQENYNMVSSIYWYTNQQSLHRPEDPRFYSEAYNHSGSSFWYASRAVLRPFALSSRLASGNDPFKWMPAVGIASYSFHNAFPWSASGATATEEVREPTAAEIRAQINLCLAYGAKSIMYYHYSSLAPNHVRQGFPIVDTVETGTGLLINRGAMGLVNLDTAPRRRDVWGEDKWDSTLHFNNDYLKAMGDSLFPLRWENAVTWDDNYAPQKTDEYISDIISERLNLFIDREDSTFVEVGRFSSSTEQNVVYLFVVNKRVDTLGQRHITVKLKPAALDTPYCRLQNVFTREEWIVQPHGDTTAKRIGGFTDYLPSGGGALYKLTPMANPGEGNPLAGCRAHDLHIAKGTDISIFGDSLLFTGNRSLFIEGVLNATDVYFGPCSPPLVRDRRPGQRNLFHEP